MAVAALRSPSSFFAILLLTTAVRRCKALALHLVAHLCVASDLACIAFVLNAHLLDADQELQLGSLGAAQEAVQIPHSALLFNKQQLC